MASEEVSFEGYKSSTLSQTADETMVIIFSRESLCQQDNMLSTLSRVQP